MEKFFGIAFTSLILIFLIRESYFLWFRPIQYKKSLRGRLPKIKKQLPFLPKFFLGFLSIYYESQVSFVWARIEVTLMVIMCLIGLIGLLIRP